MVAICIMCTPFVASGALTPNTPSLPTNHVESTTYPHHEPISQIWDFSEPQILLARRGRLSAKPRRREMWEGGGIGSVHLTPEEEARAERFHNERLRLLTEQLCKWNPILEKQPKTDRCQHYSPEATVFSTVKRVGTSDLFEAIIEEGIYPIIFFNDQLTSTEFGEAISSIFSKNLFYQPLNIILLKTYSNDSYVLRKFVVHYNSRELRNIIAQSIRHSFAIDTINLGDLFTVTQELKPKRNAINIYVGLEDHRGLSVQKEEGRRILYNCHNEVCFFLRIPNQTEDTNSVWMEASDWEDTVEQVLTPIVHFFFEERKKCSERAIRTVQILLKQFDSRDLGSGSMEATEEQETHESYFNKLQSLEKEMQKEYADHGIASQLCSLPLLRGIGERIKVHRTGTYGGTAVYLNLVGRLVGGAYIWREAEY